MAETRQHLTVRLSPADRKRIRAFSVEIGVSVQDIIVAGFNRTLVEHGFEALEAQSPLLPPAKRKSRTT
jgi:hypothetical protein